MNIQRPLTEQTFFNAVVAVVANTPTPIKANGAVNDMVESFLVSVPSTAANDVFIGDANVTVASGIQITRGAPVLFGIQQTRQLYEVQAPEELMLKLAPFCQPQYLSEAIPFICWNLSNIFLIATANTNVAVQVFRTPFI